MPDPKQTGPTPALALTESKTHAVSRDRFDAVPRKRAYYIALYVITFVLWMILAIGTLRHSAQGVQEASSAPPALETEDRAAPPTAEDSTERAPLTLPPFGRMARAIIILCLVVFYVPFISVLRTMGYPWIAVAVFCGFVFLPIPGLLVVAYLDTRIAKTWTNAKERIEEQGQAS